MNVLIDVIDMLKMSFDYVELFLDVHLNYVVHLMNHVLHHYLIIYYYYYCNFHYYLLILEMIEQVMMMMILNKNVLIQFFFFLLLFFCVNEVINEQINNIFPLFFSPNNKNRFPIQLYRLSRILLMYVLSGYVC
jgi:hypothetical protein